MFNWLTLKREWIIRFESRVAACLEGWPRLSSKLPLPGLWIRCPEYSLIAPCEAAMVTEIVSRCDEDRRRRERQEEEEWHASGPNQPQPRRGVINALRNDLANMWAQCLTCLGDVRDAVRRPDAYQRVGNAGSPAGGNGNGNGGSRNDVPSAQDSGDSKQHALLEQPDDDRDRKSTRLNSSHT